jgi:hypothetical protein
MKALSVIYTIHHDVTDDLMFRLDHTWVEVFKVIEKVLTRREKKISRKNHRLDYIERPRALYLLHLFWSLRIA